MSEKKLSTEQRIEVLEAKTDAITTGLSNIFVEVARIGEAEKAEVQRSWDLSKIKWTPAQGPRGPFERSDDVNNRDFKALIQDLVKHGGKMTSSDYFLWIFTNGSTIGRKKRKR